MKLFISSSPHKRHQQRSCDLCNAKELLNMSRRVLIKHRVKFLSDLNQEIVFVPATIIHYCVHNTCVLSGDKTHDFVLTLLGIWV